MRGRVKAALHAGLVLLCFLPWGVEAGAETLVYYFHSTVRCADCLQIESLTGKTLQKRFPRELAGGQLVWEPVNVDLPENTHFVFDYDLAANELVVVPTPAASPGNYRKLPEVWNLVHEPEKFRAELIRMVGQALAKADTKSSGRFP